MKTKSSLRFTLAQPFARGLALLAFVTLLALPTARAATKIWNQAGGGDFNTAGNWTASGVPVAADVAFFNIALSGNVTLSANATPGSMSIDTNASTFSLGALAGNTITTANFGNISVLSTLAGTGKTFTINAPIVLTPATASTAGSYTIQNNSTDATNTLVIAGGISSSTTSNTETVALSGANTGANTVTGVIGNGSATTFSLIKSGAGTWTLSGANTYNGASTLTGGILSLSGASGAINASSGVTLSGGGTLKLDNTSAANNTDRLKDAGTVAMNGGAFNFSNNAGAVNYSETTGALTIGAGANTITASQAAVGQTSALTFASLSRTGGVVNFAGTGLGVNGQNQILITTNPTLSSGIIGGWATYGGVDFASYDATNGVIQLASHTDINALGSTIADGSTTNVRLNAAGSGGNIALGAATTTVNTLLQNTTTAATVVTAAKTLRTSAIMVGSGQQSVTIGAAAGDGTLTAATAGGSLSLINDSLNNLTINAVIANFTTASSLNTFGNVALNALPTYTGLTSIGGGSLTLGFNSNLSISAVISGDGALVKEGTGTLTLSTANTFTGGMSINNGTVVFSGNNNGTFGTGPISFGSGANNTQITFSSTAGSPTNNFTIVSGAGTRKMIGSGATGTATLNGTVTLNKDLIVAATGAIVESFTIGGNISETTPAGLIIDATNIGTINLRGNNTFSGGIVINSGTLQGQNAASVGSVGALTSGALGIGSVTMGAVGAGSSASAGIDFPLAYAFSNALTVTSGGTRTISMSGPGQTVAAWNGPIALSADLNLTAVSTTLTTGANRLNIGNGSVGGGITGGNNIIINNSNAATGAVAGSGAINLAGGSTATAWTGNLIVQAGQGSVSAINAIGAANTVGVTSGAIFNFSNSNQINPTIAGLSNATASALGGSTGGSVTHTQANARTLILGGNGNYIFAGSIGNSITTGSATSLTVALTGGGSQTLSGSNGYTGATTVTSGLLVVSGSLAATTSVTVASGAELNVNGVVNAGATAMGLTGTLSGAGTVGAVNATGGTVAPGNSGIGTLNTGNLNLNVSAHLAIEIGRTSSGGGTLSNDTANVLGTVTLASGADLQLSIASGQFNPIANDILFLVINDGADAVTGVFTKLNGVTTGMTEGTNNIVVNGVTYQISYLADSATTTSANFGTALGNDIALMAIPEPNTWAMLIGGIGMLFFTQKLRRRSL